MDATIVDETSSKTTLLFITLREAAILVVAAIEDFLETPLDKSALAKRRAKVKQYG